MRTITFSYKKAVFQVQEDTVKSGNIADFVLFKLFPEPSDLEYRFGLDYGNFLARVTLISGDPGFTIPSPDSPTDVLKEFYETYSSLPRAFRNAYITADTALLTAQNAADLTPGIDPKGETSQSSDANAPINSVSSTEPSSALSEAV